MQESNKDIKPMVNADVGNDVERATQHF